MYYVGNGPTNNFFNSVSGNKYFDNIVIDENDPESPYVLLLKNIQPNSTILDIGCADGKVGRYLHTTKNSLMFGIDMVPEAVEQAQKSKMYQDVYILNFETAKENDPEYKRYNENGILYDYIILSNILEHAQDATSLLINATKRLKDGGKVLVSVPNIAHADIWLHLINGNFNYTDAGILDNTHLKFFTKNSFCEWISKINKYFDDICFECEFIGNTFSDSDILYSIRTDKPELYQFISTIPIYNAIPLLFEITKYIAHTPTPQLDKLLSSPKKDMIEELSKIFQRAETSKRSEQENIQLHSSLEQCRNELNACYTKIEKCNKEITSLAETLTAIRNSRSYRWFHKLRRK